MGTIELKGGEPVGLPPIDRMRRYRTAILLRRALIAENIIRERRSSDRSLALLAAGLVGIMVLGGAGCYAVQAGYGGEQGLKEIVKSISHEPRPLFHFDQP